MASGLDVEQAVFEVTTLDKSQGQVFLGGGQGNNKYPTTFTLIESWYVLHPAGWDCKAWGFAVLMFLGPSYDSFLVKWVGSAKMNT